MTGHQRAVARHDAPSVVDCSDLAEALGAEHPETGAVRYLTPDDVLERIREMREELDDYRRQYDPPQPRRRMPWERKPAAT